MTDTARLHDAILDAFDVVLSVPASELSQVAAKEADRIIELATAPGLRLAATVRNTTHLREAILSDAVDAYDDVAQRAEAPLCSRFAIECALERIGHFEVRDAAAHLAATVRNMLAPVSTLPSPQRLELEAALEAVERVAHV